ncbi:MAG: protein kinase [Candidatus Sumerlaeota bacterium]|nr:protein kinase [Candidatus Sumerlaeota bacterium]
MRFCFGCGFDLMQSTPSPSRPSDSESVGVGATHMPSAQSSIGGGATATPSDISALSSLSAENALQAARQTPGAAEGALAVGALVIGRYKIERKLGAGGMGSVWLARDTRLETNVALKFIASDLLSSDSARRRFIAEAKTCLSLTHPNIIRVHYFDEWQQRMFLVMECLDGYPLNTLIEKLKSENRPLAWKQVSAILLQILQAVEYAHHNNIIHRDLKPANIMIAKGADGKQRAVVMDFGLAKILDADGHTRIGSSMGTPYYMAPEQRESAGEVDARADLYSVGVIAYELLTTRIPMGSHTPASRLRSDLPEGTDAWIDRALAYDIKDRFESAEAMNQALRSLTASPQPAARPLAPSISAAPSAAAPAPQRAKSASSTQSTTPSPPPAPISASSNPPDNNQSGMIAKRTDDGRYTVFRDGVIADIQTNLQWLVGPDQDIVYNAAERWIVEINKNKTAGGGWRMPKRAELEALFQRGKGKRNMDTVFETTGWAVWAEPKGSAAAWCFIFKEGDKSCSSRCDSKYTRVFAVRSEQRSGFCGSVWRMMRGI